MVWLTENAGTILVTILLLLMVAWAVRSIIRDRKSGRSSCGGNCGACPMGSSCHKENSTN